MAEYFSRSWTGTNGDKWTEIAEGWSKVYGGAGDALIQSNAGHCGTTATERIYRTTSYAPANSYLAKSGITWKNAAGAGRRAGPGVRISGDGANGYFGEIDSNVGVTRARIRRRRGGTFADVVSWTDISGSVAAAALNAGVDVYLRVQTLTDGTVDLDLLVGSYSAIDTNDSSASAILSGGACGVIIGPNCTNDDVVFDDLSVTDFEDEATATPAQLNADVALIVDSVYYSYDEIAAQGIRIGVGQSSEGVEAVWSFSDHEEFQEEQTVLYTGAVVHVVLNGTVVAFGRIRPSSAKGAPGEGHSYQLHGPKQLAQDVEIIDPSTGAQHIIFNAPENHESYVAARANQTLRDLIKYALDLKLEGDGGLRSQLAAPASGAAYVDADLTDSEFDLVVPLATISGDVVRSVETLLSFTTFGCRIDPGTLQWRFRHRESGAITDLDIASDHIEADISTHTEKNFTALRIFGGKSETQIVTFTNDPTDANEDLGNGWPAGLETTHDKQKGFKNRDEGLVDAIGTSGGQLTMTPSATGPPAFSMAAEEWDSTRLRFTDGDEEGNSYTVDTNSVLKLTLQETAWQNGGPAAGDGFVLEGTMREGGQDNGYKNVGRRFLLDDVSYGIPDGASIEAFIWDGAQKVAASAWFEPIPDDPTQKQAINLDLPAIGLFNFQTDTGVCHEGSIGPVATVEIQAPVVTRTSPTVPTLRRPATEDTYRGTAFTKDSSKWNGGGEPGPGDPGIMRTYPMPIPEYTGGSAQDTAYGAMADALLEILSTLAREIQVEVKGVLDESWADLDHRIRLIDSSGDREMGDLATVAYPIWAVEWDPYARTTKLFAGTQSSGSYDVLAWRRALLIKNGAELLHRERFNWQEFLGGVKNVTLGGGTAGAPDPSVTCSSEVVHYSERSSTNKTVSSKIANIEVCLEAIGDIIALNKGGSFAWDSDGEELWWQNADGDTFVFGEDGWEEGTPPPGLSFPPATGVGDDGSPLPTLDALGGVEGALWNAIRGIAANLGKTVNNVSGEVSPPGTTAEDGDVHFGHDPANGEIQETPLTPGATVPPTVFGPGGGLLGNAEKTEDAEDGILAMGDTVGTSGAIYHSDYGSVALASGDTAPAAMADAARNSIASQFGVGSPSQDKAGIIWTED